MCLSCLLGGYKFLLKFNDNSLDLFFKLLFLLLENELYEFFFNLDVFLIFLLEEMEVMCFVFDMLIGINLFCIFLNFLLIFVLYLRKLKY